MNPFRAGTGLLVQNLQSPVVPIKIDGLFPLKQQRRFFARSGQITVKFGKPTRFAREEEAQEITKALEEQMMAL
jgi:long-chain acyl-CoA synthetase